MNIKKFNYIIKRLKEFQLCDDKQNVIKKLGDTNILINIIIKEVEDKRW